MKVAHHLLTLYGVRLNVPIYNMPLEKMCWRWIFCGFCNVVERAAGQHPSLVRALLARGWAPSTGTVVLAALQKPIVGGLLCCRRLACRECHPNDLQGDSLWIQPHAVPPRGIWNKSPTKVPRRAAKYLQPVNGAGLAACAKATSLTLAATFITDPGCRRFIAPKCIQEARCLLFLHTSHEFLRKCDWMQHSYSWPFNNNKITPRCTLFWFIVAQHKGIIYQRRH